MNAARLIACERDLAVGAGAVLAWLRPCLLESAIGHARLAWVADAPQNCCADCFGACWPAHRQTRVGQRPRAISSRINSHPWRWFDPSQRRAAVAVANFA